MQDVEPLLRYSPALEQPGEGEREAIDGILESMRSIAERLDERYQHATRSVHSKNHGVAVGHFEIAAGLSPHLAQGLFAKPGRYDAVVRYSTNPGDMLPDKVSTARGLALKIIGIANEEMTAGHEGETTQDFLFVDGPVLGAKGPADFLKQMKLFEQHLDDPKEVKETVSAVAQVANGAIAAFGKPSVVVSSFGGHANDHPMALRYFTQAPVRFGDYVAKFSLDPVSPELKALAGQSVDYAEYSALRKAIAAYFAQHGGVWELRAQLAVDETKTPIEDQSVEWREDDAPFETVARLVLPVQATDSIDRRNYANDRLAFDPWHALEAHRPLGGIQRARRVLYSQLARYRFAQNSLKANEPRSISDLP